MDSFFVRWRYTCAMPNFLCNDIDETLLELALREDLGAPFRDVTTELLFEGNETIVQAPIISKEIEPIVICGLPVIRALIHRLDQNVVIQTSKKDGELLLPGECLLVLQGKAKSILMLERTILNFLRHLSAIATLTRKFVEVVKETPLKILDTRKTTPGMRHLEKYAVQCGGGVNHRMGLYDAYMIKDTHIDLYGSLEAALQKIPQDNRLPVIVEVRTVEELSNVIQYGKNCVTRVLLDNMSLSQLKQCVDLCGSTFDTECSGNLTLDTIFAVAQTGVHFASIGSLTYGAGQVDLSMKIKR